MNYYNDLTAAYPFLKKEEETKSMIIFPAKEKDISLYGKKHLQPW